MRIRLIAMPAAGDFDEFQLEHYHVGQVYAVPSRLASLLILAGCAELVHGHGARSQAAEVGVRRSSKPK